MVDTLFKIPHPIPKDAILVGPTGWIGSFKTVQSSEQLFDAPKRAFKWLKESCTDSVVKRQISPSRLVFLHQDAFAGHDGSDSLISWLEALTVLKQPFLPILLHGSLQGEQLVRFFRAGLFDALAVPVSAHQWMNMLIRAEKKLEFRNQSRLILEDTSQTQDLLRSMRRKLGDDNARTTGELLKAQESLEAANRQLTDAMEELSLLYRFGRELSTAKNWDQVLREILSNLAGFIGAGGAALVLRSAAGGSYAPRMTWRWDESAWDKVLVNLTDQVDAAVAESIMAPGVFRIEPGVLPSSGGGRRIIALPMEHQELRLGYLLLLFSTPDARNRVSKRYLPFLQAVQVVLSEEVASAQMLDRIRDIGAFNAKVLETVRSGIWVIDENGKTVYCNRAGQELLTDQEVPYSSSSDILFEVGRGRNDESDVEDSYVLPELFHDARLRLDEVDGLLLPALRGDSENSFRGEGRVINDAGERIPVLVQTASMPGRLHEDEWMVVVAEDLRDTRKLEAERLKSDRLESLVEMSASLAHEIRNPLMGLSAQAELLADQLPTGDKRARYIEVITGEVERINNTINKLLNYVRPYEPVYALTSIVDLSRDVLDLVDAKARTKGVSITVSGSGFESTAGGCEMPADGAQIKQVMLNLLLNAIDAVPDNGQVELRLSNSEGIEFRDAARGTQQISTGVVLEVFDDGPGFKDGDLDRIFRPFFTTKSTGTGLGLSISYKIVEAHGGEIMAGRVSVRNTDRTFFKVVLPRIGGIAEMLAKQEEAT